MSTGNTLNGAQVIVDYLIQEKVPQVFGLCGHGNIQFIDALYERSGDIKTISVHHESVAGFMADVYYRVSGRPTATFTSCGPGSAGRRAGGLDWPAEGSGHARQGHRRDAPGPSEGLGKFLPPGRPRRPSR